MTSHPVFPDVEALAIGHLTALVVAGGRVYGEYPDEPTFPFIELRQVGALAPQPRRLNRAVLQIDARAATKAEARDVAATAKARLLDMNGTVSYAGQSGVVSSVREVSGLAYLPDETTAQPRYTFQVAVYVHE